MKKITILALLLTWGTATWAEENENQKTEEHKQVEESKRTSPPSVHYTAIPCNLTSVWVSMPITHFQANGDSLEDSTSKTRA